MTFDFLGVAQLFSIIIGAMGTPGVTYFLMKRMSRDTIAHIKESCAFCRSHLKEKINTIEQDRRHSRSANSSPGETAGGLCAS